MENMVYEFEEWFEAKRAELLDEWLEEKYQVFLDEGLSTEEADRRIEAFRAWNS